MKEKKKKEEEKGRSGRRRKTFMKTRRFAYFTIFLCSALFPIRKWQNNPEANGKLHFAHQSA